jgi:hypothetical protein
MIVLLVERVMVLPTIESERDKLIEQFLNDFSQRVANPTIEHDNELNDETHAGLEEENRKQNGTCICKPNVTP